MKNYISLFLYFITFSSFGQNANYEKLTAAFTKRDYWSSYDYNRNDENLEESDSLAKYNEQFKELLLDYTSSHKESLSFSFKNLSEMGLMISTSDDGFFRWWNNAQF